MIRYTILEKALFRDYTVYLDDFKKTFNEAQMVYEEWTLKIDGLIQKREIDLQAAQRKIDDIKNF